MPLIYWTSTTTPLLGHVFDVRVNDRIYTIVMGTGADHYVEPEAYSALVTSVQAADPGATPHVRPE
jgi:hypothetical protein